MYFWGVYYKNPQILRENDLSVVILEKHTELSLTTMWHKGLVKLIKRVKIGHSFLQSVSDQFHVIILSLPM